MKKEKIEFKNSKGQKLVGIAHIPEEDGQFPAVIYCHGYRSTKESSKAISLSKTIPEQNLVFINFDFSGRGESDGDFKDTTISQYIDDLKSAVDFISALDFINKEKIGVVGNSLGGLVALQETAKDKRIKCLVLMSPVSYFPWRKDNLQEFAPEKVKQWKEKGVITTVSSRLGPMEIGYQFYEDGLQYNDYSVYENIKIPVLILHGDKDEAVSIDFSKELVKHLKDNKLIMLEGAGHDYAKKEDYDKVINKTIKFLEKNL